MQSVEAGDQFDLSEAIQVLERTPAALRELLAGLSLPWLRFQEEPGAWSPRTVLIHLIHNERANWIPRARIILSDDDPRQFPAFRQLPDGGEQAERSVEELLTEFAQVREESLAILHEFNLGSRDFEREALHPVLGPVTLRQLLATWVAHDLNHLHQIAKSLAKRYRDAVGPWRQVLAIMDI